MSGDEVEKVSDPILEVSKRTEGGIIMQPWAYFPDDVRKMVAISSWYEDLDVTSQVLTGSDPVNIQDWAGIAHAYKGIEGGVSNRYFAERNGGRDGILTGLQAFWNHDWKLIYLHDNEDEESSYYQIPWPFEVSVKLVHARPDTQGDCASFSSKFRKNNDGGVCLLGSAEKGVSEINLSGIPASGGHRYRVDVLARGRARRGASQGGPRVDVVWSTGERSQVGKLDVIHEGKGRAKGEGFSRYRAEFKAPPKAKSMNVEVAFPRDGSFVAADDIVIFESLSACFDDCRE
ncbi:MAG: hypothetical protein VX252_00540 [Myxococcota bacterium]|nr:hypothetical protein [Myxococcota bacterium]